MRQHNPKDSVFLLCLECDRGEWRRIGPRSEQIPCRFCGGQTDRRYPVTLALREEERNLLRFISHYTGAGQDAAALEAVAREARRVAEERGGGGKALPHWIVKWLEERRKPGAEHSTANIQHSTPKLSQQG